ncbi:hypothetical protein PVAG01_09021 [Phlyctema vagabunda]|uniref:Secreted protein n=1 Tax=Phlyctema vagabunda TaxID=108571 RepID=A0ABR4P667_9HELO
MCRPIGFSIWGLLLLIYNEVYLAAAPRVSRLYDGSAVQRSLNSSVQSWRFDCRIPATEQKDHRPLGRHFLPVYRT